MLCFCWWSTRSQLMVIDNINARRLSAPEVLKLMVDLTGPLGKPIEGMSGLQSIAASPPAANSRYNSNNTNSTSGMNNNPKHGRYSKQSPNSMYYLHSTNMSSHDKNSRHIQMLKDVSSNPTSNHTSDGIIQVFNNASSGNTFNMNSIFNSNVHRIHGQQNLLTLTDSITGIKTANTLGDKPYHLLKHPANSLFTNSKNSFHLKEIDNDVNVKNDIIIEDAVMHAAIHGNNNLRLKKEKEKEEKNSNKNGNKGGLNREWGKIVTHMGSTRDELAIRSHAQRYFVKLLRDHKALPDKVKESGDGYTLSGKPLNKYGTLCRIIIGDASKVPTHLGGVESDEESAKKLTKPRKGKNDKNNNDKTTDNKDKNNNTGDIKLKSILFFFLICFFLENFMNII